MTFELYIALRHLMSRERKALISIISVISILGVVVGVTALIGVIAVMDGAQADYFAKLIDEYAHIEVWSAGSMGGTQEMKDYARVMEVVSKDPDVVGVSPVLKGFAMLKREAGYGDMRSSRPAQIFGIDPALEDKVTKFGREDAQVIGKRSPGDREIILGRQLARSMGLAWPVVNPATGKPMLDKNGHDKWRFREGAEIYALTGKVARTANRVVPKQSKLRLVGIFYSGLFQADQGVGYVSLPTYQDINLLDDVVHLVHARLTDPDKAYEVKGRLAMTLDAELGRRHIIRTWGELNPGFFKALELEKWGMFVILLLVIIVAGLNIIATLILVTMEKTREIGILRSMGTSRRSIGRIFLLEGALIGVVGTAIGVAGGLLLCYFLEYHFPIEIPEAVYGLDGLPVLVKPLTVLIIVVASVVICLLAAVLPAMQASRLDIVEALRYE